MFPPSQSSFLSFPLHWSTSNLTMCHFAFLRYPTTQLTQPALWFMHVLLCCEVCFVSLCDALILLLLGFTLLLLHSVMVKCFPTELSLSREKKSVRNKLEFMVPGIQMNVINKFSLGQPTFSLKFWKVLSNGKKW